MDRKAIAKLTKSLLLWLAALRFAAAIEDFVRAGMSALETQDQGDGSYSNTNCKCSSLIKEFQNLPPSAK